MVSRSKKPIDWQSRSRQNARAAQLLCEQAPHLPCPIVSRLYYSLHQAAVAKLLESDSTRDRWAHEDVWTATAEKVDRIIGDQLASLYEWRLKADYAKARVTKENAAQLASIVLPMVKQLGVDFESAA